MARSGRVWSSHRTITGPNSYERREYLVAIYAPLRRTRSVVPIVKVAVSRDALLRGDADALPAMEEAALEHSAFRTFQRDASAASSGQTSSQVKPSENRPGISTSIPTRRAPPRPPPQLTHRASSIHHIVHICICGIVHTHCTRRFRCHYCILPFFASSLCYIPPHPRFSVCVYGLEDLFVHGFRALGDVCFDSMYSLG
jgi:hypothetical protein